MSERKFIVPEGLADNSIEFVRAKSLHEELEAGTISSGHVVVEGTFVESLPNPLNPEKTDFKFEDENGRTIIVNGAGNLGYNMRFVNIGDYMRVKYLGKKPMSKGKFQGKEAHNFIVETESDSE